MLTSKPYMPYCVPEAIKGSLSGQQADPDSGGAAGHWAWLLLNPVPLHLSKRCNCILFEQEH